MTASSPTTIIDNLPLQGWKNVKVECAGNKHRTLRVYDEMVFLKGYDKDIRQITITCNGKIKPAIIITNDTGLQPVPLVWPRAGTLYKSNGTNAVDKFVLNGADIEIGEKAIKVQLKKKRQLPLILETIQRFNKQKYPKLGNKNLIFEGATYS